MWALSLQVTTSTFDAHTKQLFDDAFSTAGQGAQWAGMGMELYTEYEVFRRSIHYQDKVLARLDTTPSWNIRGKLTNQVFKVSSLIDHAPDILMEPVATSRIQEPQFSQTISTALQVALVDLLRSWDVKPVVCIGHSSGKR